MTPSSHDALEIARSYVEPFSGMFGNNYVDLETDKLAALIEPKLRERDERIERLELDYQKIILEVLKCDPIPAVKRKDNQLEPPWEVIARLRAQLAWAREDSELLDLLQGWLKNMDSTNGGTWLRLGDNGRIQIHRAPVPHHPTELIWHDEICILDSIPESKTNDIRTAIRAARQTHKETET